jgi:GH15 family glucan-1,4-alpha-glucosidase
VARHHRLKSGFAAIGDYAAIGDTRVSALIALDGAVDWMCLSRFDGPPVFSRLLDARRGGTIELAPTVDFDVERRYLPGTNVLETTFVTVDGRVRVTDAMATTLSGRQPWHELTRRVECLSGSVPLRWSVAPRFGWELARGAATQRRGIPTITRGDWALGVSSWDLGRVSCGAGEVEARVRLAEGQRGTLSVAAFRDSPLLLPTREEVEHRLEEAAELWRLWSGRLPCDGPWADQVRRSALALRLLVHEPTGAMAAAGSAGLPEALGGERNWDYRFAWLRDTSLSSEALQRLDDRVQVHASLAFMLKATMQTHPRLQAFYGIDGGVGETSAQAVDALSGYRDSAPVLVGNGAAQQRQLGNYGDLMQTVWLYVDDGNALTVDDGLRLAELADRVAQCWTMPDASVWELGDYKHYTQGKLAAWLALDRAARMAAHGELPSARAATWRAESRRIRDYVERSCWSRERSSYARSRGSDELDCAVLMAARPRVGFFPKDSERLAATIDALRRELGRGELMYRYSGMAETEGAFLACSFWLVEAMVHIGSLDEAAGLMDDLMAHSNDVGLMSEEVNPDSGELLGNFPQALSHLGLINAAYAIEDGTGSHAYSDRASATSMSP